MSRLVRTLPFMLVFVAYGAAVYVPRTIDLSFVSAILVLAWAGATRSRSVVVQSLSNALLVSFVELGMRDVLQRHWFPAH